MKAALIKNYGSTEVFEYKEVETPKPSKGEVLVKVLATGVNRIDHYLREGSMVPNIPMPHVLGSDAVTEVVELGESVEGFTIGEKVIPVPGYPMDPNEWNTKNIAFTD